MNKKTKEELLILVDENDKQIGVSEKLEAHIKGLLHRAFSIFIFNSKGELILQKRAKEKYHSGGLWTNTCCGHPLNGESIDDAAKRRLKEEMNIETELHSFLSFKYRTIFENGLIENEYDHTFYGITDQLPEPDPSEAEEWKYIEPHKLIGEVKNFPGNYTSWLKICIDQELFSELILIIEN